MTVKEASKELEISPSLAYQLIADGRLPHVRIGGKGRRGKIIIKEKDIEAFLAKCRVASEVD
jgi:excisionase family DNA binding protein